MFTLFQPILFQFKYYIVILLKNNKHATTDTEIQGFIHREIVHTSRDYITVWIFINENQKPTPTL